MRAKGRARIQVKVRAWQPGQKSWVMPLRSQSPKRVGSGPLPPPTSFVGGVAGDGAFFRLCAASARARWAAGDLVKLGAGSFDGLEYSAFWSLSVKMPHHIIK